MDEEQAIQRLKQGDISGLEALVALHQVRALRTAYLITQDTATAEEVVQEAFLRAYHSIQHYDPERPFAPWFLRSVAHAAVKTAQRDARHTAQPASGQTLEELFVEQTDVEDQLESLEFQEKVRAALLTLPPRQRAVIVQRYFLEMSEKEMASEMEAAPGTIKWLLHEARRRLRSLLSERTPE